MPAALDLAGALDALARRRPVFHSEADFQHELAWTLHTAHPEARIRLEHPLDGGTARRSIDLVIGLGDALHAIELKYLTAALEAEVGGERFRLQEQSAQLNRRYDVLKDLARMEGFTNDGPGRTGTVIVIANAAPFWAGPKRDDTFDAAFSLREGRRVEGTLSWHANTGAGTTDGRAEPIVLRGRYLAQWHDFSEMPDRNGRFRSLVLAAAPAPAESAAP